MAETAVCSPTRSDPNGDTMQVEVDLDDTQVFNSDGKWWKQDNVAKEILASCAEDAASKDTKEMISSIMRDVEKRRQRYLLFEINYPLLTLDYRVCFMICPLSMCTKIEMSIYFCFSLFR